MSIRTAVLDQIKLVARQQDRVLPTLTDALPLLDSGLDSLCIAILVANLEEELGLDPFNSSSHTPRTLGELIGLYENAAA
jgi:acyl carrier protein